MGNGMLSQEEIDALLSGAMDAGSEEVKESPLAEGSIQLSDMEMDAMGEIANISMGTAATTLSQLVGKRVEITAPKVDVTTAKQIMEDYPVPHVLIDVKYKKGIEGSNMLVLSREDGSIIVDLMMGGTGNTPSTNLSEIQLSGISEAMNQMMGSAATSMSTMFNSVVDITPPRVILAELDNEEQELSKGLSTSEPVVRVSFRMAIEGIIDSVLIQVLPFDVARGMVEKLIGQIYTSTTKDPVIEHPPTPPLAASAAPSMRAQMGSTAPSQPMMMPPVMEEPWQPTTDYTMPKNPPTFVQPAQFAPLSPSGMAGMQNNLGLIYDVPLQVNVELGKATKTIKEILDLGPGSVVELDRLAGEPVDMIVNGKLIAKCEVVVINETFGIRITEIVNPNDRIDTLN
ncbi:flagellar motor switch phosphatase FliY [Dehalobacter sp. DCM]|uniref:flagellar motor switch phosphatase FliY n=1 Tax=Dehalobacter sp. DCM TaxID=2907827 RepID=UPI003081BD77|nr:flagellar motor switch phosphatase FliY [Dehalobacter sp. DCM]